VRNLCIRSDSTSTYKKSNRKIMSSFDYQGLTPKRVFPESMDDSLVGRKVMYKEVWNNINVPYEYGTITSFNERYVFIDFRGNGFGQACKYNNVLLAPTSIAPHICTL
jgi:hypothetical protein